MEFQFLRDYSTVSLSFSFVPQVLHNLWGQLKRTQTPSQQIVCHKLGSKLDHNSVYCFFALWTCELTGGLEPCLIQTEPLTNGPSSRKSLSGLIVLMVSLSSAVASTAAVSRSPPWRWIGALVNLFLWAVGDRKCGLFNIDFNNTGSFFLQSLKVDRRFFFPLTFDVKYCTEAGIGFIYI